MIKPLITFISCAFFISFSSCNIINPDEPMPGYLKIDSVDVIATASGTHGSVSDKITDVWVYLNNQNIGNYELPASIPYLVDGDSADLVIFAGIKANGLSFNRRRYPFYTPFTMRLAKSIETRNITPKFEYRSSANFLLVEDFENGNSFISFLQPDTTISRDMTPQYVYEGVYAGLIYLNDTIRGARAITTQSFVLPKDLESFMELDYKCDIPFTIEVQITSPGNSVILADLISIKARNEWNKIYINLTEVGTSYQGSNINFILRASLTPDDNQGFVAIDNLKIVTQ